MKKIKAIYHCDSCGDLIKDGDELTIWINKPNQFKKEAGDKYEWHFCAESLCVMNVINHMSSKFEATVSQL